MPILRPLDDRSPPPTQIDHKMFYTAQSTTTFTTNHIRKRTQKPKHPPIFCTKQDAQNVL